MRKWRALAPAIGAFLFCTSVIVLVRELERVGFAELTRALEAVSPRVIGLAVAFTLANYAVLTLQDQLAVTYARISVPRGQVTLASFIAYAVSNSVGFAMLSGTSARYRFYSRWNVAAADLSRIVLFYSVSFWIGLGLVAGASLAFAPRDALGAMLPPLASVATGASMLLGITAYAVWCVRGGRVRVWRLSLPAPSGRLMAAQMAVSVVDWLLAAAVFYVLLPPARPPFLPFAGGFAAVQLLALASHVPGGLGVFEGLMLLLLKDRIPVTGVAPALVAYRVIYYALPLATALILLLLDETSQRRSQLSQFRRTCHALATWATPRVLALFTFASGTMLLFSGATPAVPERLRWIASVMPLPLVEASHFTASLTGLLLLVLSQAIARRVDAAFYLTATALAIGSGASLIKGGDFEEAAILTFVLVALISARRQFTRRARVLTWPLPPRWTVAIATAIAASVWLGLFAYRHVAYTSDLWWQFAVDANAPRFLRASIGVTVGALAILVRLLLGTARPRPAAIDPTNPTPSIDRVIALQPRTLPYLVYLGDKSILWNDDQSAFVMYAISGSTCVAMGDPVGSPDAQREMVRRFVSMCDHLGLTPAFYQISAGLVALCTDSSLTAVKLGEEGWLSLRGFSFAGSRYKDIRTAVNRFRREGYEFVVLSPEGVTRRIDELQEVSDDWLASKAAAEKSFSLGSFGDRYVQRFPAAILQRNGSIEAFATLWPGPGRVELSPDLMRHRRDAPAGVMDALFGHTILWAQDQGYERFNLGMAPLSGIEGARRTDTWARLGRFVYRHGEPLYNFQGVRNYKEKFHPEWEPRYLAYPRGRALARVLADVTALIAGGYRRILLGGGRRAA